MTQRDRPAPEGGSQPTASPASLAPPCPSCAGDAGSLWDKWYQHASAEERQQILDLAGRQGVLCATQLPASPETAPGRSVLAELLAGSRPPLPPLEVAPLTPLDPDLDETQRSAVARALATPDLALIQGYPGSGKSRVVAELLRQSDRLGRRSLFVGATAASVDRVLERLAIDPATQVVRCLAPNEPLDSLPGFAARLTVAGRKRDFDEKTLPAARRAAADIRGAVEARQRDGESWTRFENLLERREQALDELARLELQPADRAVVESQVQSSAAWQDCSRRHEEETRATKEKLTSMRVEYDRLSGELKQCDLQLQGLVPLAEATQSGRWWTGAFWKAKFRGDIQPQVEDLRHRCKESSDRHDALGREIGELELRIRQCETRRAEEQERLLAEEVVRHTQQRDTRLASLRASLVHIDSDWATLGSILSEGTARPAAVSREALTSALAARDAQSKRDLDELTVRTRWLEALEATRPVIVSQQCGSARIVACPLGGVPADAGGFDLLVVEEAGQIADSELLTLSKRAARTVLVCSTPFDPTQAGPRRPHSRGRVARPAFSRLWQILHQDFRSLEPRWSVMNNRLVVHLRAVGPDQQRWLQFEPVYDRPEIELGIVSPPRQVPRIVEVRFPATTPIEEARAFVSQELEELAIQTAGPLCEWHEGDRSVTLVLDSGSGTRTANLSGGVREHLCSIQTGAPGEVDWKTCALEFDRDAGWDLARARDWVVTRLGLHDLGRTTLLCRSHRTRPELARALRDLLADGFGVPCSDASAVPAPALEFVAVPSLDSLSRNDVRRPADFEPRRGGSTATLATRPRSGRGGAGIEIDLADMPAGSRRDALSPDIRSALPARGLVNILEARALLAALEDLVSEPAFQSASADWSKVHPSAPSIGVLSLLPAQATLLRVLVQRSAVVAKSGVSVEVGQPDDFRQRECQIVMVSLTRSHTHRAVPFTDHPESMVLALTRACSRVILFGDAGTLARRSQWNGGLDHLDDITGPQEQLLVARLLETVIEPEPASHEAAWGGRSRESNGV